MPSSNLRNIGIIAHIDAGKTTFSERILFYSEVIHRMGEVHEGAATMDFMPEEQERGITIASACISCLWGEHTINLVDTPGHVDFTVEVERCLRVLDAAVGIFCAVGGVEPQSETVWRQADAFHIPRLAVVNKMDRVGASYSAVLDSMRERLGVTPVPVTVPLGEGEDFKGVLDLVRGETLIFDSITLGKQVERKPFSPEEAALAAPWRDILMDALTMEDDALLDQYLTGEEPAPEQLDAALRKGTLARRFVPVFAASALRNMGVQPVLDAICRYLPAPEELPPAIAQSLEEEDAGRRFEVVSDPDAPVRALAFKVVMSGGRKIVFLRLYSGRLREGNTLVNPATGKKERVMRLYRLHAQQRESLELALAGDIVAVQGLKEARTGDTLLSSGKRVLFEPLRAWRPVISLAFEPKNTEEGDRLDAALETFAAEDPTLAVEMDEATGQRIVSGMGELHLEVLADRIKREWNIAPRVGNPQVVCRETVAGQGRGIGEFDRELGGQAHYGLVEIEVTGRPRSAGISVSFEPGAADPAEWHRTLVQAVEQGVVDACYSGPNGYPVEDVAVRILRLGRGQGGLATPPGMHMAAQQAVRHALKEAAALILEPVMQVDISVPDSFLGAVVSLLGARGARVEGIDDRAGLKRIRALAPMRGLFGFATSLRSATQGRAGLQMRFVRFDSV